MDKISEIKSRLDIATVVGSYVTLTKSGRNYKGVCPFHSEKTPSFMVSPELGIYKCFGCQAAGDIFKFIQQIENVEFSEALKILASKAGVELDTYHIDPTAELKKQLYFVNEVAANFYQYLLLNHQIGKRGLEYAHTKRKLTTKTIKDFGIGYAPQGWSILYEFLTKKGFSADLLVKADLVHKTKKGDKYIDKFRDRLMFPIYSLDKKIVGFTGRVLGKDEPKYLNTSETLVYKKREVVYALSHAKLAVKSQGAVLVEGQMDVITAHQHGFTNVLAVTGTALTPQQLNLIKKYTSDLILCFDADRAGLSAAKRALNMAELVGFNIFALKLPKGFKDVDELISQDPTLARQVFEQKVGFYQFLIGAVLENGDTKTSSGKRAIMAELKPYFLKIHNAIDYDHYCKLLAQELDLDIGTVLQYFQQSSTASDEVYLPETNKAAPSEEKMSSEGYFLGLLLNADLDTMLNIVYKIDSGVFVSPDNRQILEALHKHLQASPQSFTINELSVELTDEVRQKVEELYLFGASELTTLGLSLPKVLEDSYRRLSQLNTKTKLADLSEKIKLAELQGDSDNLKKLTKEFNELSKLKL